MVQPRRPAKPNLATRQHSSPYGDIVEAAQQANVITPPHMDKVAHVIQQGVARIPRFGNTTGSAAYSRLGLRVTSLKDHGQITETAQDTLLNFFRYTQGHSITREEYDTTLRTMHDRIETAVANERKASAESNEGQHPQSVPEIAFAVGRYSLHMAMKYELGSPTILTKGAGFDTLIQQMEPEARTVVQACIGYALPSMLYQRPKR